ncbi:MAG: hypothetical protein RIR26_462 [Pseudomonadota bacterium]|jgi:hypothetical protein
MVGQNESVFRVLRRPSLTGGLSGVAALRRLLISISLPLCVVSGNAWALERRDVSGEREWSSASLQGAAGMGRFSDFWLDQAQTEVSLLARRKATFEMELFGQSMMISRDAGVTVLDTVKSFSESNQNSSSSGAQAAANALDKVRSVFGKSLTTQAHSAFVANRIGRVGIAPYLSAGLDATIDNVAWPKLDAYAGGYGGVLCSYAQAIGKDFDVGAALRPGVGGFRSYELDLSLFGSTLKSASEVSTENPLDQLKFPVAFYLPLDLAVGWWMGPQTRFHLTSKNTFDAKPLSTFIGSPGRLQNRINLGFSQDINLDGGKNQNLLVGGELQDIAGVRGGWNEILMRTQWAGRYAVKLPFRDQTTFAINAGLHSGFPVLSVYLDLFVFKVEYAMSARENGAYPGQRPNRLHTFSTRTQMQF